jgi:exopolysaccharide biosynthesis protein
MVKNKTFITVFILSLFLTGCSFFPIPGQNENQSDQSIKNWTILTEDLKNLIIVQIDPRKYKLQIIENSPYEPKTIEEIHNQKNAVVSFNGQFFDENFEPLGLLISDGELISEKTKSDLMEGIIAIDENFNARLFPASADLKNIEFAIQNGPIILDENGQNLFISETGKIASRTALGLDKNNNLILIVLKQSVLNYDNVISLHEFGNLLENNLEFKEMGLHSVLNLDGGPSSGLALNDSYFPEMEKVQNIIIVTER